MNRRFVLISRWRLGASRERVWQVLTAPETWPRWWPRLLTVRRLSPGDADGRGAVNEFAWASGLGYRVEFVMATVRVEPEREIEGAAEGAVRGSGLWLIEEAGSGVRLTYRWDVELEKPWMRLLAPLLRPVFAARHFAVMRDGARGMARHLGCRAEDLEEWSAIAPLPAGEAGTFPVAPRRRG